MSDEGYGAKVRLCIFISFTAP